MFITNLNTICYQNISRESEGGEISNDKMQRRSTSLQILSTGCQLYSHSQ